MEFIDALKLIGGLAGIAALVWRCFDEFGSYLRLSLKVDLAPEGWVTVLSTVDNKGYRPKPIDWAFLVVGPESESPVKTVNTLLDELKIAVPLQCGHVRYTNDMFSLKPIVADMIRSGHRMLAPLPFYFSENIDIADETLGYRTPIDVRDFPVLTPFSIRFFVGNSRRLHRSTHECFIIGPEKKGEPE